ncbi:MAG: response regulator transcription factor [Clostridia bacterium]|nr:response regulator transcription factor [Clostridia bacterium]MBR1686602.1 response regulator transcription factor [Clostridia bacterium]MBR2288874.1 response regulator transcription factor [Clostridia bacterium]
MIYLLEDDDSIRKLVVYTLESQGFQACGMGTPEQFWDAMAQKLPELVLLDIMLPGEDGISILRRLRGKPSTAHLPVIMLTAKNTEYDRVEGLDAGADDYISKPFGMMEMVARVRAVLRRTENHTAPSAYRFGALYLCPERHEVRVADVPRALTYKEFMLLTLLVENRGLVLTREILLDRIWGLGAERENRTLDVHIRTLRAKLGEAGNYIQTIRGVGYRFTEESL